MMPLGGLSASPGLTSDTTSGTSGSLRQADELSTTIAPASATFGAYSADIVAPAEKIAMSMPVKSAVSVSSTTYFLPPHVTVLPAERAEEKTRNSSYGNFLSASRVSMTRPTWPVAPKTPTRMAHSLTAQGRRAREISGTRRKAVARPSAQRGDVAAEERGKPVEGWGVDRDIGRCRERGAAGRQLGEGLTAELELLLDQGVVEVDRLAGSSGEVPAVDQDLGEPQVERHCTGHGAERDRHRPVEGSGETKRCQQGLGGVVEGGHRSVTEDVAGSGATELLQRGGTVERVGEQLVAGHHVSDQGSHVPLRTGRRRRPLLGTYRGDETLGGRQARLQLVGGRCGHRGSPWRQGDAARLPVRAEGAIRNLAVALVGGVFVGHSSRGASVHHVKQAIPWFSWPICHEKRQLTHLTCGTADSPRLKPV